MRSSNRRLQFRLAHLMVAMTVIAVLVQPTAFLVVCVLDHLRRPESATVTVPDGGTLLIGGMKFRPDSNRSPAPPRKTIAKTQVSMTTATVIIEEEEELIYLPTQ